MDNGIKMALDEVGGQVGLFTMPTKIGTTPRRNAAVGSRYGS